MGKRLIVAEKPSVGRDIAKVLGCRDKQEGAIFGDSDIVSWAFGHLVEECYPEEMDERYEEWKMEDLPIIPEPFKYKIRESKKEQSQFEVLRTLMNDPQVDRIVCATDAGREGELIFRYIYDMAGCSKPVDRLWISSLTYRAIKEGFENLKSSNEYDNLYESARCRSEADWLVGINGSRALAIANDKRGLSVGRVLSPTLAILVDREIERRNFQPEKYLELVASFNGFEGKLINPANQDREIEWSRFLEEEEEKLKSISKAKRETAVVVQAETVIEQVPSQLLYDLTSLQRDANRLFGYSSKMTLDIAQKLYERHKAITYPRTDSRYISADMKSTLSKRLDCLCTGDWEKYAKAALCSDKDLFGRFILDRGVSDHHAIIPTGEAKDMENWTAGDKNIYDLIARRFIGMFLEDCIVEQQKAVIRIGQDNFLSTGEKLITEGWTAVDRSRKSKMQALPELSEGDLVSIYNLRVRRDETRPPAPHTEASLLNAMEHAGEGYGIGTPATRAATIEKLIEKYMVTRKGRVLFPTGYGIALVNSLPDYLKSAEITGQWESRLEKISKGEEHPGKFMDDIKELTRDMVGFIARQGDTGLKDANSVGKCPLCGQAVIEYSDAYYCANSECGFRRIWKAVKGFHPTLSANTMTELLENGTAKTIKGVYSLIKEEPYIAFERNAKPEANCFEMYKLILDYDLKFVNKVKADGGNLWIKGGIRDEKMQDFAADCERVGCSLRPVTAPKALSGESGWYVRIDEKDVESYAKAFGLKIEQPKSINTQPDPEGESKDELVEQIKQLIAEYGFKAIDKTNKGGNLWIIAGKEDGTELADLCKTKGAVFVFSEKGSKATSLKPGWYWKP